MPKNATGRVAGDLTQLSRYAYRWDMPEDTESNEGLGGGLLRRKQGRYGQTAPRLTGRGWPPSLGQPEAYEPERIDCA
eukprot:scaffold13360_cov54-Phaeocystis_antarctica.AAC.1